jgi:hypothetical protein
LIGLKRKPLSMTPFFEFGFTFPLSRQLGQASAYPLHSAVKSKGKVGGIAELEFLNIPWGLGTE